MGYAPPTDSGDTCYKHHDYSYASCLSGRPEDKESCLQKCDATLIKELLNLNDDPKKWPNPPPAGTESDSQKYRGWAIWYFR